MKYKKEIILNLLEIFLKRIGRSQFYFKSIKTIVMKNNRFLAEKQNKQKRPQESPSLCLYIVC